jgi:SAM-dependent methyltransferase
MPFVSSPVLSGSQALHGKSRGSRPARRLRDLLIASPTIFDRKLRRQRLDRAAATHDGAGFLHQRAARDLAERLAMLSRTFPVAVEVGARQGALARALGEAAPGKVGLLIETGLSRPMLGAGPGILLAADEERLPLAVASVDLVISALALHWTNDLVGALIQARQALTGGGLFLAALLGGATLTELRQVLLEAEIEIRGGAGPRVSPFADAADAAGLLSRAGFVEPVVDVDRVSVRYDHPLKLLADLRAMGETSVLAQRPGPLRRAVVARASELYLKKFASADGRITASFEILTLTGWAPGG